MYSECAFYNDRGECVETYYTHINTMLSIFNKYFNDFFKYSHDKINRIFSQSTIKEKHKKGIFKFIITISSIMHDAGKLTLIYQSRKHRNYRHEVFSLILLNELYNSNESFYELINNPVKNINLDNYTQNFIKKTIASLVFYHHEYFLFKQYTHSELREIDFSTVLNTASKFSTIKFKFSSINKLLKEHYPEYTPHSNELSTTINAKSIQSIQPFRVNQYYQLSLISKMFNILVFLDNLSASLNRKNKEHALIFNDVYCYNKLFEKIIKNELGGC